jgi:membrane protein implicated in regulation of membrane protease activity
VQPAPTYYQDVAWYWWIVVGLVLAVVEMLTVDLIFVMLAAGAIAAAIAAFATDNLVLQALVAVGVAGGALALVRPVALRHLTLPHAVRTGTAALVGSAGLVLERVDARNGRVKLGGEVWSARSYDPGEVLEPGTSVEVARIDGATAVVYSSEP